MQRPVALGGDLGMFPCACLVLPGLRTSTTRLPWGTSGLGLGLLDSCDFALLVIFGLSQ